MKKLFIFMFVVSLMLSLNSCSKDEAAPVVAGDSVTMRVGGVLKTFNTVTVTEEPYTEEGEDYVDLIITASNDGNLEENLTFGLGKGYTGTNITWGYGYFLNNVYYYEDEIVNPVNSNTTVNSNGRLTGTFSGMITSDTNATLEMTQGTFDVTY